MNVRLLFIIFILWILPAFAQHFHKFVFVTPAYNNQDNYQKNLQSMLKQDYPEWAYRLIYIDDCSTDGTGLRVKKYLEAHRQKSKRVTFIQNMKRRGQLANVYDAVHQCHDNEIVVIVDGDDRLAHSGVLKYLNTIYRNPEVWLTYGQFVYSCKDPQHPLHGKRGVAEAFPKEIVLSKDFRRFSKYVLSHPRTYYAWLFKQITIKDLLYNSYFYLRATDCATMFPMIEMVGTRFRYVDEPLYIYTHHEFIDRTQIKMLHHIRQRKTYPTIERPIHTPIRDFTFLCIVTASNAHNTQAFMNAAAGNIDLKSIVLVSHDPAKKMNLTRYNVKAVISSYSELVALLKRGNLDFLLILDDHMNVPSIKRAMVYLRRSHADAIFFQKSVPDATMRELFPRIYALNNKTSQRLLYKCPVLVTIQSFLKNSYFIPEVFKKWRSGRNEIAMSGTMCLCYCL